MYSCKMGYYVRRSEQGGSRRGSNIRSKTVYLRLVIVPGLLVRELVGLSPHIHTVNTIVSMKILYNLTTLCLGAAHPSVDFMDVNMRNVPLVHTRSKLCCLVHHFEAWLDLGC